MRKIYLLFMLIFLNAMDFNNNFSGYIWSEWSDVKKESFLSGFLSSQLILDQHLKEAVRYDKAGNPYWQKPFVIVMYEKDLSEYSSVKVGFDFKELKNRIDMFYDEEKNLSILLVDAIRIVCLRADGDIERADWFVFQSRQKIESKN